MEVHHVGLETWHRREIVYTPARELTVADTLHSDQERRYIQWHNFAPEFDLSGVAGRFRATDGEVVVDVEVTSSCGERTTYEMIKGQTTPRIHGWASVANRERHPRWALGVVCEAQKASFAAHLTFGAAAHEAAFGATEPGPE